MTPTAGKDGEPGNDECEFPPTETTPPASVPPAAVPPAVVVPPTTTTAPPVTTTAPPKPAVKPKPKPKVVVVVKPKPKQPKLTGNPKTDKCKDTGHGTLNCKGVTVVQGSG